MESDLLPIIDHRLLPDRSGVRAGALERRRGLDAAGLDPAHNDPPDAFQRDPDGRLHLQKSHFAVAAHHPMVWSIAIWAAGHLLSNGSSADLVLFGAFLVWAVADLRSSYARDRRNAMTYPAPNWGATIGAVLLGVVMWIALLEGLHLRLFGESPMAM